MKIVEKVAQEPTRKNVRNVTQEVTALLKTMLLVESSCSADYFVALVRGESRFPLREEQHAELETFGALKQSGFYELRNLMHCMYEMGLVEVENPSATRIYITEKGKLFLDEERQMELPPFRLKLNKYMHLMDYELRKLVKQLAIENNTEGWKILSDFAIGRIIRKQPVTLQELKQLPGITLYKAENYGQQILDQVAHVRELRAEEYRKKLRRKVGTQTYQDTKRLFESGRSIHQIAQLKDIMESTVREYLMNLHLAGEIDLRPWIEDQLDAKTLFKGADYFKNVESPRFREAYEVLGLDYDTLRLCRLYVSDVSKAQLEVDLE